ncbi:unnamed protein product [Discosporangium mesarthrocarpum]
MVAQHALAFQSSTVACFFLPCNCTNCLVFFSYSCSLSPLFPFKVTDYAHLMSPGYIPDREGLLSAFWHRVGFEDGLAPRETVISQDTGLNSCWAMKGPSGKITISLARSINVQAVSIEHASRMVTMDNTSVPREFEVYGLKKESDQGGFFLGRGKYGVEGRPIQTFDLKLVGRKFRLVKFEFLSNWGNPDFTCIYRLRVHGSS